MSLVDPATGAGTQPVGLTGYTLVMSEEFGGTMQTVDAGLGYVRLRPDGPRWATWYPDWPMFDAEVGDNRSNTNYEAYYDPSKVSLTGGTLRLMADRQTSFPGLDYTAGMIQSLPDFAFQYGYAEARIKIDTAGLQGHWPAFWLTSSTYNTWPPEIDIWEYFANGTQYEQNVYVPGQSAFNTHTATMTDWHVFGCRWNSSGVTFYLDGVANDSTAISPSGPQYVILNNGARTPATPTFQSTGINVDYVRIWQ